MAVALLSNHPLARSITKDQLDRIEKGAWYHSIDLADGRIIPGIISVEALRARMDAFGLPTDLRGKRVLDVGAATGWCSFEMERRGADVVAVDCVEYDDFRVAHRLLNSRVDYRLLDIDEFTPESLGTFDIVVFFGVLYHLRNPLLGLERVLTLARDTVLVESFVCDAQLPEAERNSNGCYMEFYETDQLGGQIDNWMGPTVNCLLALCRAAGFVRVELKYVQDSRAGVICRRKWENAPASPAVPAPVIGSAVNNRTQDVVFHPGKDEYICLYFRGAEAQFTRDDLRVEIDGFGVPVLTLSSHGENRWQANLRVPAGLAPGSHTIRVRLAQSGFGESATLYSGGKQAGPAKSSQIPAGLAPQLYRVSNALSGSRDFFGLRSEYLCCCFHLDVPQLDREGIVVEVGGRELIPSFVGSAEGWGEGEGWQANVKLPPDLEPGALAVRIRTKVGPFSNAMNIIMRSLLFAYGLVPILLSAAGLTIDHVTVAGTDLKKMQTSLVAVGIHSEYGGPHNNHATEMALTSFPDGSYVELIAIQSHADQKAVAAHYWSKWLEGNAGPCAWAVRSKDIAAELKRLEAAGVAVSPAVRSGRERPDGTHLEWEAAPVGKEPNGTFFPFLIHDLTPREQRAFPNGKATTKDFTGIARVVIAVRNLNASVARYQQAYGLSTPVQQVDAKFGAHLAMFGGTPVILAEPLNSQSWLTARLERFGEGPCAFIIGARKKGPYETASTSRWFGTDIGWFDSDKLGWHLGVRVE